LFEICSDIVQHGDFHRIMKPLGYLASHMTSIADLVLLGIPLDFRHVEPWKGV
jgi:hypothetical protein